MFTFFKLLYGPKLYWVYLNQDSSRHGEHAGQLGQAYQPEGPEKWGHTMVSGVKFMAELGVYVGPLLLPYIYKRMDDLRRNPRSLADFALVISCVYMAGLMLRAAGRVNSPVYREFFEALSKAKKGFDTEAKEKLARYDFDFASWPVEFNATRPRDPSNLLIPPPPKESAMQKLSTLPHRILGWAMMNVFGLKLLYPGSTRWFLQALIGPAITEHRAVLVNKHRGQRVKLGTADDNEIDSMFFDRRGSVKKIMHFIII